MTNVSFGLMLPLKTTVSILLNNCISNEYLSRDISSLEILYNSTARLLPEPSTTSEIINERQNGGTDSFYVPFLSLIQ